MNEVLAFKSKLLLDLAGKNNQEEDPKIKLSELEKELENVSKTHLDEIESIRLKNDLTISQLRSFFDQEKSRIEQKLVDEKNKSEKRMNEAVEEFEEKFSSEKASHAEEIAVINEEFSEMETIILPKSRD